jgi:hypothetical protein
MMGMMRKLALMLSALIVAAFLVQPAFAPVNNAGLRERARPVFEVDGVVYVDEADDGMLEIGVVGVNVVQAVQQRLAGLGIPLERVRIVVTKPIYELATLRDEVRPLVGGIQIAFVKGGLTYLCTLGFIAVSGGKSGFITNSHCTSKEFRPDGTVHHQPLPPNPIGAEISDPPAFDCGVRGLKCRWSDAAFDQLYEGVAASLGYIASTTGVNDGSITIATLYKIAFKHVGNAETGTTLRKVGRTTGQTEGVVVKTCVDVRPIGSRVIRLCQDIVAAGTTIVAGGDSGSPVFKLADIPDTAEVEVELYGVLWGGSLDGYIFVYSPLTNIEKDLGTLQVN